MRFDPPLKIAAAESWLPEECETVTDAVLAGKLEPERAARNGYLQLAVSDVPPPQMAVLAAESALTSAGISRDDVGLLIHAWTYYQGYDYWEPVHYVLNGLSLRSAAPLGVSLGCNGGDAAGEAAAWRLRWGAGLGDGAGPPAPRVCPP